MHVGLKLDKFAACPSVFYTHTLDRGVKFKSLPSLLRKNLVLFTDNEIESSKYL